VFDIFELEPADVLSRPMRLRFALTWKVAATVVEAVEARERVVVTPALVSVGFEGVDGLGLYPTPNCGISNLRFGNELLFDITY
jgi:hypothetical protein